jgi:hypothetical protein
MRGTRKRGARRSGGRQEGSSRAPQTPSERQAAADKAQSLRRNGEELVPAAKLAKAWGIDVEEIRDAIAEIELQPDHVVDGCAYYSSTTARRIKEQLKR